ncbi:MAG TPA: LLM class flavin-dependent oxidoreductase [Candidatus Limnocylindrales bacterium]|nr:LLM class flavin-dependent oxidoreductase [Candidatus Limnocylindrales bacterium]
MTNRVGFSIDSRQGLPIAEELRLVRLGAELGYASAWTPSGPDAEAFDRCLRWYRETGLRTGISVVPASGQPPSFYAEHARRVFSATNGTFVLGLGSGQMPHAAIGMRRYLADLRGLLPQAEPIYLAALGPRMLSLAGEIADGVALNWCTPELERWSRQTVEDAARRAGRPAPPLMAYIRTAVDPDRDLARRILGQNALVYALGPPAYRRHFERMGFADELRRLQAGDGQPSAAFLDAVGAAGRPGEVRAQFECLAEGLDEPVVRVLVTRPGDATSAERTLRECAPGRGT